MQRTVQPARSWTTFTGQTDGQQQRYWILGPARNLQCVLVCIDEKCPPPPLNVSPADTGSEWRRGSKWCREFDGTTAMKNRAVGTGTHH